MRVNHNGSEARYTSRDTITLPMVYFQLTVPSVLFYVVESTSNPRAVTADVASSSLVVPAIFFTQFGDVLSRLRQ